jgi:hypothetical protein
MSIHTGLRDCADTRRRRLTDAGHRQEYAIDTETDESSDRAVSAAETVSKTHWITNAPHSCDPRRSNYSSPDRDAHQITLSNDSQLYQRIDLILTFGPVDPLGAAVIGADPRSRTQDGLWPSDHAGVLAALVIRSD